MQSHPGWPDHPSPPARKRVSTSTFVGAVFAVVVWGAVAVAVVANIAIAITQKHASAGPARPPRPRLPPVAYQEAGTEDFRGRFFAIIIVPKGTSWPDTCRLAAYLHDQFPLRYYEIRHPGDETGAVINKFPDGGRMRWGMGAGESFGHPDLYWLEP